ncbi:MAG TPA: hypothetical protein VGD45_20610 [Steroidobacter sp.]|uniref:hypothetical protein n=1 Tax=Steroidobacter sp. TaxID=1978227 RepID=UPI002EDAE6AD
MPLLSDLRGASGGHYLYDLLDPPGAANAAGAGATATASASNATVFTGTAGNASGAGVTDAASAATGSALGYALVTVAAPILNAPGSIFYGFGQPWGNFDGTPQPGDTIRHETRNGFRIAPNGEVEANEYGTYTYFYQDGTGEVQRSITLDASAQVFPSGATATASASDASLYGGVNIAGDAPDVAPTPASGTAAAGNIATGAGPSVTATPASGSVQAGAAASGAGPSATATPATGVGENIVIAEGDGVGVTATPAQASASGDVFAVGGGATAVATPASAVAVGDRLPGSIPYTVMTTVYPRTVLIARAAA